MNADNNKKKTSVNRFESGKGYSMYPRMLVLMFMFWISILIAGGYPSAAQDLSDQGKRIVNDQCTKCHNLRRVKSFVGKLDMSGWTKIVEKMVENGAKLTQEEKNAAIKFLSSASTPSALD